MTNLIQVRVILTFLSWITYLILCKQKVSIHFSVFLDFTSRAETHCLCLQQLALKFSSKF